MNEKSYRIHIRQGEFELDVEGDRAFVETYIEAFLAEEGMLEMAPPPERARRGKARTGGGKTRKAGRKRGAPEVDKDALRAFMARTSPSTNKERYFQYVRFWNSVGVNEVSDAHVKACFITEGLPVPPTGRQNFSTLRSKGLIQEGSKRGSWKLTGAGEKADQAGGSRRGAKKPKAAKKGSAARRTKRPAAKGPNPSKRPARRRKTPRSVSEVLGLKE